MNDLSFINWDSMSDKALAKHIGTFIKFGFNAEYCTFNGWDSSKIKTMLKITKLMFLSVVFSRASFQEKLPMKRLPKT